MKSSLLLLIETVLVLLAISNSEGSKCCSSNVSHEVTVLCTESKLNCKLEDALSNISNNTRLVLSGSTIELSHSVEIKQKTNICIESDGVVLYCNSTNGFTITFQYINNLCIQNIAVKNCGSLSNQKSFTAISIKDSQNVMLTNLSVSNSIGGGIKFNNTVGNVVLQNCSFFKNPGKIQDYTYDITYGGGIHVVLNNTMLHAVNYHIDKSTFESNAVIPSEESYDQINSKHGGGAFFHFKSLINLTISITNTKFINNTGGLTIHLKHAVNNKIRLTNVTFTGNEVTSSMGGGLYVFYKNSWCENHILLKNVTFSKNKALGGGGMAYYTTNQHQIIDYNCTVVEIQNCTWTGNIGQSGAAAIFTSEQTCISSTVSIVDSSFIQNTNEIMDKVNNTIFSGWVGHGILLLNNYETMFDGLTNFTGNKGSAIGVINGNAVFRDIAVFKSNRGWNGGAICLRGSANIMVDIDTTLEFYNNSAEHHGGAIHIHLQSDESIFLSTTCPIRSYNTKLNQPTQWKATFNFTNNTAASGGNSIYITSLLPCMLNFFQKNETVSIYNIFKNFPFVNVFEKFSTVFKFEPNTLDQVNTAIASVDVMSHTVTVIPGMKFKLPISVHDDTKQLKLADVSFTIGITNIKSATEISWQKESKGMIRLYGSQNDTADIVITTTEMPHISQMIHVMLSNCPFGYYNYRGKCKCKKVNWFNSYINGCNEIKRGAWVGYINNETETISLCPTSYCKYESNNDHYVYTLPDFKHKYTKSIYSKKLEKFLCNENREGTACGECKSGYTVYFNSPTFSCKRENELCDWGWFFYILTYIFPLTFLFILITVFGVKIAAGNLRGFVLYSQILVSLDLTAGGVIMHSHEVIDALGYVWRLLYNILNLRFFYLDNLSYCIIKSASSLDVVALQYVSTVYALLLIITVAMCLNHCSIRCNKICKCVRFTTLKGSFVNSLSALLILCYGNSTHTSFLIINTVVLYMNWDKHSNEKRVYLQPNLAYMKGEHLVYALPAYVCLFTIVLLPLAMFVVMPLVHLIITKLHKEDTVIGRMISKCYLGGKLKPFYDTFQGSFKENYRFFAGMYFLYDLLILAVFPLTETYIDYAFLTEVILVVMLTVHCVTQPYSNPLHNVIDALMFANLVCINGLTCLYYLQQSYYEKYSVIILFVQLFFIYLPFMVMLIYLGYLLMLKFTRSCCKKCDRKKTVTTTTITIANQWLFTGKEDYGALELSSDDNSYTNSYIPRHSSLNSLIANEQGRWPGN